MAHPLAMFDRVAIINLVDRRDRRRESTRQIEKIGGFTDRIAFFDAERPDGPDGFPSVGARGCFMSHLTILRSAFADGIETLLLLEDDFNFAKTFLTDGVGQLERLQGRPWDMYHGAYRISGGSVAEGVALTAGNEIETSPFVAFASHRAIGVVIEYLESLLDGRKPGRIHVDGAYNEFRWAHPEIAAYAAAPQLGYQRSSASSITPSRWSQVPVLGKAIDLARRLKG